MKKRIGCFTVFLLFFFMVCSNIGNIGVFSVKADDHKGEPFYYWHAPENSMGVDDIQYINWSWIEENVDYTLTRDDIDVTDTLVVNFSYVFTHRKYSYEFIAGVKGYFEFTLVFNSQSVSSWINSTNVSFNYSDGSLFYDFSDIASIQQIDLEYSLVNGIFTLIIGKQCNKNVHVVLDPIFGQQSPALNYYGIGDTLMGYGYFMGTIDGVADSMTAQVRRTIGSGKVNIKMAIYDMSANLIGETDEINVDPGSPYSWQTATFSAPKPELTASIRYALVVISDNALIQVGGIGVFRPPYYGKTDSIVYASFPEDPATWSTYGHSFSIYCTYTEVNIPPVISGVVPVNQSTNISLYPLVNFTVYDANGDTMYINISENTTGSWITQQFNVSGDGNIVWANFSNASAYSTRYDFLVNISDGNGGFVNSSFWFVTEDADMIPEELIPIVFMFGLVFLLFRRKKKKRRILNGRMDI